MWIAEEMRLMAKERTMLMVTKRTEPKKRYDSDDMRLALALFNMRRKGDAAEGMDLDKTLLEFFWKIMKEKDESRIWVLTQFGKDTKNKDVLGEILNADWLKETPARMMAAMNNNADQEDINNAVLSGCRMSIKGAAMNRNASFDTLKAVKEIAIRSGDKELLSRVDETLIIKEEDGAYWMLHI